MEDTQLQSNREEQLLETGQREKKNPKIFFFPRNRKMAPMRLFLHFVLIHCFILRPS